MSSWYLVASCFFFLFLFALRSLRLFRPLQDFLFAILNRSRASVCGLVDLGSVTGRELNWSRLA